MDCFEGYAKWHDSFDQYGHQYGHWIPDRPLVLECDRQARNLAFGLAIVAAYEAAMRHCRGVMKLKRELDELHVDESLIYPEHPMFDRHTGRRK